MLTYSRSVADTIADQAAGHDSPTRRVAAHDIQTYSDICATLADIENTAKADADMLMILSRQVNRMIDRSEIGDYRRALGSIFAQIIEPSRIAAERENTFDPGLSDYAMQAYLCDGCDALEFECVCD